MQIAFVFYRKLIGVLKIYVDEVQRCNDSLLNALKSLEFLFKFAVKSRLLYEA